MFREANCFATVPVKSESYFQIFVHLPLQKAVIDKLSTRLSSKAEIIRENSNLFALGSGSGSGLGLRMWRGMDCGRDVSVDGSAPKTLSNRHTSTNITRKPPYHQ